MMGLLAAQLVITGLISALYAVIFAKAGFRGAVLLTAAGPLLAELVVIGLVVPGYLTAHEVLVVALPISLLPLLILAFKSWPSRPAAPMTRSET